MSIIEQEKLGFVDLIDWKQKLLIDLPYDLTHAFAGPSGLEKEL